MTYTVSITSQGQLNIPISVRRQLGLTTSTKAILNLRDGAMLIEPIKDLLSLKGSLLSKKKLNAQKSRAAFEVYLAEQSK